MSEPPFYRAVAMQSPCYAVQRLNVDEARAQILKNIERLEAPLRATLAFQGSDVRLVVYPEYFLTGFPMGESAALWREKSCLRLDGPEYEALGALAQRYAIYLAGNAYEVDPHFPELYFQTSFILDPSGDVCLRYRRLNSMYTPTPHDVWDEYLSRYGVEGVFPVVSTPLGRLSAIASEEILYPELTRCVALRGAEVIVHSTSEVYSSQLTPKAIARRARAQENLVYLVSANSAGIYQTDVPAGSTDGGSELIDYRGLSLASSGPGESMTACAEINLGASRLARRRPGMSNTLARQRFEAYRAVYQEASVYPPNTLSAQVPSRAHFINGISVAIERLSDLGVIERGSEPRSQTLTRGGER